MTTNQGLLVTAGKTAADNTPRLNGDGWRDSLDCQLPVIRQALN